MAIGLVKWYNDTKGFGFIDSETGSQVFVHRSGLNENTKSLRNGQQVSFEVEDSAKGPMAVNVKNIG